MSPVTAERSAEVRRRFAERAVERHRFPERVLAGLRDLQEPARRRSTLRAGGLGLVCGLAIWDSALAIPALAGAGLVEGLSIYSKGPLPVPPAWLITGSVVSFLVGIAALWSLERVLQRGWLHWFGWYCIALGMAVTAWQLLA